VPRHLGHVVARDEPEPLERRLQGERPRPAGARPYHIHRCGYTRDRAPMPVYPTFGGVRWAPRELQRTPARSSRSHNSGTYGERDLETANAALGNRPTSGARACSPPRGAKGACRARRPPFILPRRSSRLREARFMLRERSFQPIRSACSSACLSRPLSGTVLLRPILECRFPRRPRTRLPDGPYPAPPRPRRVTT
jgi:hypothetical protein